MKVVCLAATVLFCATDFNALRGCILRSANPEPDLENLFCTTEIAQVAEIKPKSSACPVWSVVNLGKNLHDFFDREGKFLAVVMMSLGRARIITSSANVP
jgi:hypothetical protein